MQNIKSYFRGGLIATTTPYPSKCQMLSLTLRMSLQKPWILRPWSSSDSDQAHWRESGEQSP